MTTLVGFSHLSLSVTDLDRSTEWYREMLGFAVDSRVEGDGFRRNRLRHPDAGITLTLTAHQAGSGDPFDERRTGMDHVSFAVPSIEDLHDLKEQFQARGIEHSEVKPTASGAGGMITFRDPDNIQLELFAAG
ncbi:MAG: VOC family protein [Actinomycetota bacterium]|nr:VOC family protein [Actinomycetota bacterium]